MQQGEHANSEIAVNQDFYTLQQSVYCSQNGVIVHIGLLEAEGGLDVRKMTLQEITFIGTYTYTMADFRDTVAALDAGKLGELKWIEKRP